MITYQYNNIWNNYIVWQRNFFEQNKDLARDYIIERMNDFQNKKILDIGCWDWHDIAYYETIWDTQFYWVDSSEIMTNEAKILVKNPANIYCADFETFDFENEYFDIIISKFALHYKNNLDNTYKNISRLLKRNWKLIFVVNHPINDFKRKNEIYSKQENIITEHFFNWVKIIHPSHTIWEILSREFLDNFILEDLTEDYMLWKKWILPLFLWIVWIKK